MFPPRGLGALEEMKCPEDLQQLLGGDRGQRYASSGAIQPEMPWSAVEPAAQSNHSSAGSNLGMQTTKTVIGPTARGGTRPDHDAHAGMHGDQLVVELICAFWLAFRK